MRVMDLSDAARKGPAGFDRGPAVQRENGPSAEDRQLDHDE